MTLKSIRNLNQGWFTSLMGLAFISSGMSMVTKENIEKTFLCFDEACITVQGISCISLGILTILMGMHMIIKLYRLNRTKKIKSKLTHK